jgi:hypothetical protein
MIKFFRHIRQNLLMENRTERIENVQWTFLVNVPACRAGIKLCKHD